MTTNIPCFSNHHNGKTKNEPSHCLINMSLAKGPILYHPRSKDRKSSLKSTPVLWHLLHMQALGKFSGNSTQLLTNTHPKERTRHFSHISSCLKCSFFGKREKKRNIFLASKPFPTRVYFCRNVTHMVPIAFSISH